MLKLCGNPLKVNQAALDGMTFLSELHIDSTQLDSSITNAAILPWGPRHLFVRYDLHRKQL